MAAQCQSLFCVTWLSCYSLFENPVFDMLTCFNNRKYVFPQDKQATSMQSDFFLSSVWAVSNKTRSIKSLMFGFLLFTVHCAGMRLNTSSTHYPLWWVWWIEVIKTIISFFFWKNQHYKMNPGGRTWRHTWTFCRIFFLGFLRLAGQHLWQNYKYSCKVLLFASKWSIILSSVMSVAMFLSTNIAIKCDFIYSLTM